MKITKGKSKSKVVLDYEFQTDGIIEHQRSDIPLFNKTGNKAQIADVIISVEYSKQIERMRNYSDLKVVVA